jgi:hypothetical protein
VRAVGAVKIVAAPADLGDTAPVASFSAPGGDVRRVRLRRLRRLAHRRRQLDVRRRQPERGVGPTVTHVFEQPAARHARLRVVDDDGTSSRVYSDDIIIQAGASASSRKAAVARPFTARLLGVRFSALPPERGSGRRRTQHGVRVRVRFRGRLRGPVRAGDVVLRRLLRAS